MSGASPILVDGLNHSYGKGDLRKQVLFDVGVEIHEGEIVIVTGPSGSGKTTMLTLVGALRSAQDGSIRILGEVTRERLAPLREADAIMVEEIRREHDQGRPVLVGTSSVVYPAAGLSGVAFAKARPSGPDPSR